MTFLQQTDVETDQNAEGTKLMHTGSAAKLLHDGLLLLISSIIRRLKAKASTALF
jgi:hypothetical protein